MYITEKELDSIRDAIDMISSAMEGSDEPFAIAYTPTIVLLKKIEQKAIKDIVYRKNQRT